MIVYSALPLCMFSILNVVICLNFINLCHLIRGIILQPDNPAELSGKIYEMMSTAMASKWASHAQPAEMNLQRDSPVSSEPIEAEVIEPELVDDSQKK